MTTSITLPSASDFHIHLRQGDMMRMVTPKVEEGGVSLAYVMVSFFFLVFFFIFSGTDSFILAKLTTSYYNN